jgi:hypothetical protein
MRGVEMWYSHMDAEVFVEESKSASEKNDGSESRKKRGFKPPNTFSRKWRT